MKMSEPGPIQLNYATAGVTQDGRRPLPKFRIGVFSLYLSVVPVVMNAMVYSQIPHSLFSGCSGAYDRCLEYGNTAIVIGAAIALLGLFQRGGRIAALVALLIYLIESILVPAMTVCH